MDVTAIMNRVRKAIKEHDPSYRLKIRGLICAKEMRYIMYGDYDFTPRITINRMKQPLLDRTLKDIETIDESKLNLSARAAKVLTDIITSKNR